MITHFVREPNVKHATLALVVLAASVFSGAVSAQVDCSPLDPRAEVSKRKEAELQVSADTAFKIAKASGTLRGAAESKILALPTTVSPTEQSLLHMRSIYIFCGMVANARDLTTTQKFNLYKELISLQQAASKGPPATSGAPRISIDPNQPKPFVVKKAFKTSDQNTKDFGQAAGGVGIDVSGTYQLDQKKVRINIHRLRINIDEWDRASAYIGIAPGCGESYSARYVTSEEELFKYDSNASAKNNWKLLSDRKSVV